MKFVDILIKDLRQTVATWQTPVFLVVMPILFTIFFGIAFAGSGDSDPRVPVAVVNADVGRLGDAVSAMVADSDVVRRIDPDTVERDAVREAILDGDLAGALLIPAGFSEAALSDDEDAGVQAEVLYDPGEQAGQAAGTELQSLLMRTLSAAKAASIAADARASASDGPETRLALADAAVATALDAWEAPPVVLSVELGGQRPEEAGVDNSYAQSSPGMMVQFGITGVMSSATLLVNERRRRTLERLLTTATPRATIIAGKVLAAFILIFGQMLLLTGFGQLIYGLPYYDHPAALLLLNVVFATTIACMGLLIGAVAKNEEAVILLTLIPTFILSALGGAWFPLELMPEGIRTVGRIITPTAWAMEAYQDLIVRGLGLQAVLLPVAVITAWGAAFFALAIWRLRFVEK